MEHIDIIHGPIKIPKHIEIIIQTPQFQRLKGIKQLGLIYKTRPQANSTRYEHCIGTYFLANKMLDSLERNTKYLKIPDFYRKVVTIAALLHDVGHGPFSHTWETICCGQYHHEENASECIDDIFRVCLTDWKVDRQYAIELIKSFIVGDPSCLRDQEFRFLFDIVNNKQCNVDVDKWDYLKRDFIHLKESLTSLVNMDFTDVFMEARVSCDRARIVYRYCDFHKIYDIFDARATFHINFYRIPIQSCLENILKHIICESQDDLERIDGIKIQDIRSKDMNAFLKLNDDEIWRILKGLKSPDEMLRIVRCLENVSISQIYPVTDEEKLLVPQYLRVETRIANAGEEMPIENILFYGDETEKPAFEQKKGFFESVSYFQLMS